MRLIDADALNMYLSDVEYANRGWKDDFADTVAEFMAEVDERPTIDAVPVVRCAECKFYHIMEAGFMDCICGNGLDVPNDDDFCSYGERRSND